MKGIRGFKFGDGKDRSVKNVIAIVSHRCRRTDDRADTQTDKTYRLYLARYLLLLLLICLFVIIGPILPQWSDNKNKIG
jgi:hypothetical protein